MNLNQLRLENDYTCNQFGRSTVQQMHSWTDEFWDWI